MLRGIFTLLLYNSCIERLILWVTSFIFTDLITEDIISTSNCQTHLWSHGNFKVPKLPTSSSLDALIHLPSSWRISFVLQINSFGTEIELKLFGTWLDRKFYA